MFITNNFDHFFFYDLLLFHQIVYGDTERTKVKHSHIFCDSLIIHGVLHPFLYLCIIPGTTYNSFTSTPQNLKQKANRKFIGIFRAHFFFNKNRLDSFESLALFYYFDRYFYTQTVRRIQYQVLYMVDCC